MANLTILRNYASKPSTLPPSILFDHTDNSLTIFDLYPKSNSFHFLLIPRITDTPPFTASTLSNLKSLLQSDKEHARACIAALAHDAADVKRMIIEEMRTRFGFEWPVFMGFHAVPSMEHLHLHIIASDFFADTMKTKKHYNSFHPKLGFFLHLEDVLEWFEATPSHYESMLRLSKSTYEPLLKEDLVCWRCDEAFKTIPKLKAHLKSEWEADAVKAKAKAKALERNREQKENVEGTRECKKPAVDTDM